MIEYCYRGHERTNATTYRGPQGTWKQCRVCAVENRKLRVEAGGPVKHGNSRYADGCRCEVCREGHRLAEMKAGRARRTQVQEQGLPSHVQHGVTAYRNWGCRCAICKEAASSDTMARRRAKDEANGIVRRRQDGSGYLDEKGYKRVRDSGHPNARKSGWMFEHVRVMSEVLGRPLVKGENVHHKNGVKHDNRPENLELWVVSQPSGQRPSDLLDWAYEIIRRYENEVAA